MTKVQKLEERVKHLESMLEDYHNFHDCDVRSVIWDKFDPAKGGKGITPDEYCLFQHEHWKILRKAILEKPIGQKMSKELLRNAMESYVQSKINKTTK
jgi:hypothetical protein